VTGGSELCSSRNGPRNNAGRLRASFRRRGHRMGWPRPIFGGLPACCLALADLEHLGAADRAHALGCRAAILHDDLPGVVHFALRLALHAVGFHIHLLLGRLRPVPLRAASAKRPTSRYITRLDASCHEFGSGSGSASGKDATAAGCSRLPCGPDAAPGRGALSSGANARARRVRAGNRAVWQVRRRVRNGIGAADGRGVLFPNFT